MNEMNEILQKLSTYPQVDAIAIGGSRATKRFDATSDYDVYIYLNTELPEHIRRKILEPQCSHLEIGNHYWELEDNGTLNNGIDFDLVYRNIADFTREVADVVEQGHFRNSYTTCFWHNLMTCQIIHERNNMLTNLKKRFDVPYPKKLKQAILHNHLNLLHGVLPSFDAQIKKAYGRGDYVSVNHRTTEFLATYFDLLFAINETFHPGEKRLVSIAKETCKKLPEHFEEDFEKLFQIMFTQEVNQVIEHLVKEITVLVKEETKDEENDTDCR
ncbi:MAG: nucleotidyltransferase domain-containing protein [bacterium]|nr:nucleotidyltransferase domain-containing protein [bacterium]